MAGKGDTPRPCDKKRYDENYDKIDWNDGSRTGPPAWEPKPKDDYVLGIDVAKEENKSGVIAFNPKTGKMEPIENIDMTAKEIMDMETKQFTKALGI